MIFALIVLFAVLAKAFAAPLDMSLTRMVGGGGSTTTLGNSISVLSSGKIVLSGYTNGFVGAPLGGATDGFVRCFGPDGSVLWTNQVTTGPGGNLQFVGSVVDSSDNIYVVARCIGSFYGVPTSGDYDVCVVKFDPSGFRLQSFVSGGPGNDQAWKIGVDKADGSVYVVGGTTSSTWNGMSIPRIGTVDAFVLRISYGALPPSLFGAGGQETYFYAVDVDSAGYTWAAGYTKGSSYRGSPNAGAAGTQDFVIQKMNPYGSVLFSTLIGGPGIDMAYGVTTDASNSAYICGYTTSTFDGIPLVGGGRDLVVVKYNSAGVKQWSKTFGGSNDEGATGVSFDKVNNVLLVNGYTMSASFSGLNNPYPGTQLPFLIVLNPLTGSIVNARLYIASGVVSGNAVANNGAFAYLAGNAYTYFQGQSPPGAAAAYMMRVEGFGGAPSVAPSARPTVKPTALPTFTRTETPTASPTRVCVQWALGDVGATCSATCSALSRVCKESYFAAVVTQEAFYAVVASSVNVRSGQALGSAAEYCSAGSNTVLAGGAPAAQALVFVDNGVSVVHTACSYPTSLPSSTTLSCDAEPATPSGRRFCPCVDDTCDAPSAAPLDSDTNWFLGDNGDSCDAACTAVGRSCNAAPVSTIKTNADFLAMVAATTDTAGISLSAGLPTSFCNSGINVNTFASAPAALTFAMPGTANQTSCTYPILSEPLNGACDVSFPRTRRFCSCKMFPPTVAPTAAPTFVPSAVPTALPTTQPTALPTFVPTTNPSATPTVEPTYTPSAAPTAAPSAVPTVVPTYKPSAAPTAVPTATPTTIPTATPTVKPTALPTALPTTVPTVVPTVMPSVPPTFIPTFAPSAAPSTATPSVAPTAPPSALPTVNPTYAPTTAPSTAVPTFAPSTAAPTTTVAPTVLPTYAPTLQPYSAGATASFGVSSTDSISVKVLSSGDVILAGHTQDNIGGPRIGTGSSNDIYVLRYSFTTNSIVWARQFTGTLYPYLAVDASDNIYVSYSLQNEIHARKFDLLGNFTFDIVCNSNSDGTSGITVDSVRQALYIVTTTIGSVNRGTAIKYNSTSGAQLYKTTYMSSSHSRFQSVAVDSIGNLWVLGSLNAFPSTICLFKLDTNGNVVLSRGFGNEIATTLYEVTVDSSNNVYVAGGSRQNGGMDAFVAKYNSAGTLQWSKYVVGDGDDRAVSIGVDSTSGQVFMTGVTWSDTFAGITGGRIFLLVLSTTDGSQKFVRRYQLSSYTTGAAVLSPTNVYIAGYTTNADYTYKAYLGQIYRPSTGARRLQEISAGSLVPSHGATQTLRGADPVSRVVYTAYSVSQVVCAVAVLVVCAAVLLGVSRVLRGKGEVVVSAV